MVLAYDAEAKAVIQQILGMAEAFGFDSNKVNGIIGTKFFKEKEK